MILIIVMASEARMFYAEGLAALLLSQVIAGLLVVCVLAANVTLTQSIARRISDEAVAVRWCCTASRC